MHVSLRLVAVACVALFGCGEARTASGHPTCGGGFAEETWDRYRGEPGEDGCFLRGYFSGVAVELPAVSPDQEWVLSGTVGDEAFACTVRPGMVEGDPCSDNPAVQWAGSIVRFRAHPCDLSLHLEVAGEAIASTSVEPDYEWSEPNGAGCGWKGVAHVVLVAAED